MSQESQKRAYKCRNDVVRRILQRELDGLSLRTAAVKRQERPLYAAAIRLFGIWSSALRAAGVDPESVSGRRVWTEDRVLRRIRELERQGIALNAKAVKNFDQGLTQMARKYWGSWDNALCTAGFEPANIRILRPAWRRSTLLKAIQAHAASGGRVTWNSMRPRSIGPAARRLFGSFNAALRAAGVWHERNLPAQWSPSAVKAAIRRRRQNGEPLNCMAVVKTGHGLCDAARHYYGGWNQALRAAGMDPDRVRAVRRPWTRASVIDELRRRVAAGVPPTRTSSIRPIPLVKACRRIFGSCEYAALAAGVDPAKIGYYRDRPEFVELGNGEVIVGTVLEFYVEFQVVL